MGLTFSESITMICGCVSVCVPVCVRICTYAFCYFALCDLIFVSFFRDVLVKLFGTSESISTWYLPWTV